MWSYPWCCLNSRNDFRQPRNTSNASKNQQTCHPEAASFIRSSNPNTIAHRCHQKCRIYPVSPWGSDWGIARDNVYTRWGAKEPQNPQNHRVDEVVCYFPVMIPLSLIHHFHKEIVFCNTRDLHYQVIPRWWPTGSFNFVFSIWSLLVHHPKTTPTGSLSHVTWLPTLRSFKTLNWCCLSPLPLEIDWTSISCLESPAMDEFHFEQLASLLAGDDVDIRDLYTSPSENIHIFIYLGEFFQEKSGIEWAISG